ncbi:hypothetical protein HK405_004231 [Cladochytrium tenue]|nr:hypothetical protein HK405_004231 [Cladochytrium tenue]
MHLFRKATATKVTPKDAIIKLREQLELLEKREKFLESQIDKELKVARANASKNKRAALMALKKKKAIEGQIERISGSRLTLEQQIMTIETANINMETMNAMKTAANALNTIHKNMDINQVDKIMDSLADEMAVANELSEAITRPVDNGMEYDDEELLKELEDLEQEELDQRLLNTGLGAAPPVPETNVPATIVAAPELPSVALQPRPVRPSKAEEEDEELAALRASMA